VMRQHQHQCQRQRQCQCQHRYQKNKHSRDIVRDMGGTSRKHIIFILCDGMGNNILNLHLKKGHGDDDDGDDDNDNPTTKSPTKATKSSSSFLHRYNQPTRIRAVFPSTTPAALTTLATACWPGQHGVPGWDLRIRLGGCEFPGDAQQQQQQQDQQQQQQRVDTLAVVNSHHHSQKDSYRLHRLHQLCLFHQHSPIRFVHSVTVKV